MGCFCIFRLRCWYAIAVTQHIKLWWKLYLGCLLWIQQRSLEAGLILVGLLFVILFSWYFLQSRHESTIYLSWFHSAFDLASLRICSKPLSIHDIMARTCSSVSFCSKACLFQGDVWFQDRWENCEQDFQEVWRGSKGGIWVVLLVYILLITFLCRLCLS